MDTDPVLCINFKTTIQKMSQLKELNISPVGRVEGDLDVKVYMENGTVTKAHTQAAMFRGFEKILVGKDPQSGLIVTPRACGICGDHTCTVPLLLWM